MKNVFITHQFKAGNSQAVRIPSDMAFPPKTELIVTRKGNKLIVEPAEKTMEHVLALFTALAKKSIHIKTTRPKFIDAKRE